MIKLFHDNILVSELVKDSKAGALIVSQDASSAYMYVKIEEISEEASKALGVDKTSDAILIINRVAKMPFIQNTFFISYKDVKAVIDKEYFEEI